MGYIIADTQHTRRGGNLAIYMGRPGIKRLRWKPWRTSHYHFPHAMLLGVDMY